MKAINFGENLQRIRKEQNLSQKNLAEMLNTTVKTISHWETGYSEPSLAQLADIIAKLDVSYDDLMF